MIEILDSPTENVACFRVDSGVEKAGIQRVDTAFARHFDIAQKLRFDIEVRNFGLRDIALEALL